MSRPKPTVLFAEHTNETAYEVCAADAVYAVFCRGEPINLKQRPLFTDYPGPKYIKSSFANSAHALNLADKLNQRFNTEDFSVVMLTSGRTLRRLNQDQIQ